MCSITGFLSHSARPLSANVRVSLARLLKESEARGHDGFGYTSFQTKFQYAKTEKFLPGQGKKVDYQEVIRCASCADAFIANHRAEPTTEYVTEKKEADQQPYNYGSWWAVHNGTIANDQDILNRIHTGERPTRIDSYAIPVVADAEGPRAAALDLIGSQATLLVRMMPHLEFVAYRNYKPLTILWSEKEQLYIFSSLTNAARYFPHSFRQLSFPPYTYKWGFFADGSVQTANIKTRLNSHKALVVCSGGLDSTVATTRAVMNHKEVCLIHFSYGCIAEEKEGEAVEAIAKHFDIDVHFVDMRWLKQLGGSTLTEDGPITEGVTGVELAHEWVPARNTAMLGIAASYADRYDIGNIYLGLNLEEAGAYPDNTAEFYEEFNKVLAIGTQARPVIINPLGNMTKKEIVDLAYGIDAPIHLSWSCYKAGEKHCGVCGPCTMRRVAHMMAGREETIEYEQPLAPNVVR